MATVIVRLGISAMRFTALRKMLDRGVQVLMCAPSTVTPDDVRLIALHPGFDAEGRIVLNMNITGRSLDDATAFLRALEESPVFTDVALAVESRKDSSATGEVEFTLSTFYNPGQEEGRVREIKP